MVERIRRDAEAARAASSKADAGSPEKTL